MDSNDRGRNPPTRDIYAFSVRPARGLGQGLDRPNLLAKTSSARKLPDNDRAEAASARYATDGSDSSQTARPSQLPPPGTSSFKKPRRRLAQKSSRTVYPDNHNTLDPRFLPTSRDLLPKPTYSLKWRPGIIQSRTAAGVSAARKTSIAETPPGVFAARKTWEQDPSPAGRSAARKYVDPSHKSVRFLPDQISSEDPRRSVLRPPLTTTHSRLPGTSNDQNVRQVPSQRPWIGMKSASPSSAQRNVPAYRETGFPYTPLRISGTPAGLKSVTSNDAGTPRSAQAARIARQPEMKSTTVVAPRWHTQDATQKFGSILDTPNLRKGKMATASRKSISSISAMGANILRRDEDIDVVRVDNVTKGRVWLNMRVTGEDDDSFSEMEEDEVEHVKSLVRPGIGGAARKRRIVQTPLFFDSGASASSEEPQEESQSEPEPPGGEDGEDGFQVALNDLEDDFDALYFNEPILPDADRDTGEVRLEPTEELMRALESIALASLQMQRAGRLPFLRRQLRRGFEHRCRLAGVPTDLEHNPVSLSVVYKHKMEIGDGSPPIVHEYQTRMDAWLCPLCELHGSLKTRQMLAKHLEWDHVDVACSWQEVGKVWRLMVALPQSSAPISIGRWTVAVPITHPSPSSPIFRHSERVKEEITVPSTVPSLQSASLSVSDIDMPSPVTQEQAEEEEKEMTIVNESLLLADSEKKPTIGLQQEVEPIRPPPSPFLARSETLASPTPPTTSAEATPTVTERSTVEAKPQRDPTSLPQTSRPTTSMSVSHSRSTTAATTSTRRQISTPLPDNYPPPPPADNPLGPSIQHPFLPVPVIEGRGVPAYFSCRPGGPRLYDLLNALDMEEFGVLSWYIIDKEEEIFECDDVLDEDKVMQALWARWIFLHRNHFVANYLQGTKAFINKYWLVIHGAAGWAALRAWLLVLAVNRFLTGAEVAEVLQHYEGLTGMEHWCKIVPTERRS